MENERVTREDVMNAVGDRNPDEMQLMLLLEIRDLLEALVELAPSQSPFS